MYRFEWMSGIALLGTALVLLLVPSFALIALVVVAFAALAALVVLAAAILALPYYLVGALRRGSVSIATAIAHTARTTKRSGFTALARPITARQDPS